MPVSLTLFDLDNAPKRDFPAFDGKPMTYAIAAIPRSGSNLAQKALWSTNKAGAPKDYFAHDHKIDFEQRWGKLSLQEYRDHLIRHRTSPNGVFGFKVHWFQFAEFFGGPKTPEFRNLIEPDRIIYMSRRDHLRQAISWVRALQSERFTSEMQAKHTPLYKRSSIEKAYGAIRQQERQWKDYFTTYSIEPLSIVYEDLASNYRGVMAAIAKFLDLTIPIEMFPDAPIAPLADHETEVWVERFITESRR